MKPSEHRLISEIVHPANWTFVPQGIGFGIISPKENEITDIFNESLSLIVGSAVIRPLEDVVSSHINNIKDNYTNFELVDSQESSLSNNAAHKIVYTYRDNSYENSCQCDLKEMVLFTIRDKIQYMLIYATELDKFTSYLPAVENITRSIKIQEQTMAEITTKSRTPAKWRSCGSCN